ncbi:MAG: hypothetical protein K0R28_2814 [Paenibacillus sp.]|jgi:hypothetical protein|nr:hypothetical protein [Paenibacillus sp.]
MVISIPDCNVELRLTGGTMITNTDQTVTPEDDDFRIGMPDQVPHRRIDIPFEQLWRDPVASIFQPVLIVYPVADRYEIRLCLRYQEMSTRPVMPDNISLLP